VLLSYCPYRYHNSTDARATDGLIARSLALRPTADWCAQDVSICIAIASPSDVIRLSLPHMFKIYSQY